MNVRCGLRRVAVVLSAIVGLVCAVCAISVYITVFTFSPGILVLLCLLVGFLVCVSTSLLVWFIYWVFEWVVLGFSEKVSSEPMKITIRQMELVAVCIGVGALIVIAAHFIWPPKSKEPKRSYTLDELFAESTEIIVTPLAAECLKKYVAALYRTPPNDIPPPPPPGFEWLIDPNDIPLLNHKVQTNNPNSIFYGIK